MKAKDLMVGDWVIRRGVPEEHMQIYDTKASAGIAYLDQDGRGITEKFENIEPIPLTSDVLEKNEFKEDFETNGIYWRPDCRKFCIVKELDTWYFAFRVLGKTVDKSSGYICISECGYVHKLQHMLRDLEIEKEIVL